MEISTDGYLHKKFKKQLNTDHMQIIAKEQNVVKCVQSKPFNTNNEAITVIQNRNDVVPNFSTNNENIFLGKSSISHIENSLVKISDEIGGLGNSQSFNNCISYVISNSDRVDDINQDHSQNRAVNFDRRFNILETISIPRVETSSILDNVYSNQYVTSKLVSVENIGDISSSSNIPSNYEHVPNAFDDASYVYERNVDNQPPEPGGITEKSSGGKYVCSYCNLACSKPSVLQKHIRAHTNERPYPCVSCGFSFKTRSNLYKHCRSRTHANRVMGNKAQEIQIDGDSDSQSRMEYLDNSTDDAIEENIPPKSVDILTIGERNQTQVERRSHDLKTKPYKPRFHTAKAFYEDMKDNQRVFEDQRVPETVQNRPSNSQMLSSHINDVISKNNAIVNSDESFLLKKRSVDTDYVINQVPNRNHDAPFSQNFNTRFEEKRNDEPLNLTNKIRKRCISEVTEPTLHTSLIKELLIKNLYSDPNMQCPHCKMIFQTVTELELHKLRSCKAFIKSGARYSRSSSVNVASILTKNKNAFDSIPHLQNTVFPLKSPGPFLGKTRLVESDKTKSFSFDDSLSMFRNTFHNHDILKATLRSSISSLTLRQDSTKKAPVKLFGGEVKITQTSGETKSFKIDNKEPGSFTDYSNRLSENRVIQSSLQSGGTVLQNTSSYTSKQDSLSPSPNVIRVFENNTLSPSIDITNLEKTKFNFDRVQPELTESSIRTSTTELTAPPTPNTTTAMYNYTDIMDFSQKAAQLLAPNLKQPNFTIPGIPMPSKIALSHSSSLNFESKQDLPTMFEPSPNSRNEFVGKPRENEQARHIENIQFAQNQIFLQQRMSLDPPPTSVENPNMCNPVNLLVNGKVIRYVPGMPGPVAADIPLDVPYVNNNYTPRSNTKLTFAETPPPSSPKAPVLPEKLQQSPKPENRSPVLFNKLQIESERVSRSPKALEIRTNELQLPRLNELRSPNNPKSPTGKNFVVTSTESPRKFARPNTLALKPSTVALKQHHGLTPTMFNQILISPDTPRVAKKYIQHFLHGNYFSYLGLKSSTKSVYCTLNKTQPSYVPHFKKLSMYSEWRQQETKGDKLYASAYDSRQRKQQRYVTAGRASADLVVHSSYKCTVYEDQSTKDDDKTSSLLGGYESNEEYTYVRGRGRGRYVCDQCGIRCKKPSMLKKHVRTHTNDRPYTCSHCNFSFKTKGNLTKHMKSKAHTKNYAASNSSNSSAQQSGTQSSESDTDDSGMDSSDESTRQQEHEAAYGLLSLSQKTTQNITGNSQTETTFSTSFMNAERVTQVNNSNFAKNKILDKHITIKFNNYNILDEIDKTSNITSNDLQNITQFLGKTNVDRPLTYPYTSDIINDHCSSNSSTEQDDVSVSSEKVYTDLSVPKSTENRYLIPVTVAYDSHYTTAEKVDMIQTHAIMPVVKVNDTVVINNIACNGDLTRKRNIQEVEEDTVQDRKYQKINTNLEAIDLSMTSAQSNLVYSSVSILENVIQISSPEIMSEKLEYNCKTHETFNQQNGPISNLNRENKNIINLETPPTSCNMQDYDRLNINYVIPESSIPNMLQYTKVPKSFSPMDYDNSAMETLADVATKQVKLEKHLLAKNVASEFIKLTAKKDDITDSNYLSASPKEVNDLLGKPEENKSCTICDKNFSKPSQLRLHMNIHYLERPFRCDPCSTSFRTKGHLQKHERSAGHHNKLSSPLLSSSEPRPFKCTDCSVGFRIHGHLAKHLRSKQHIMKLEWLAKIPIGLYAELERSSNLLTEINTTDADQCLESLKALARKLFVNPSQPNQTNLSATFTDASDS